MNDPTAKDVARYLFKEKISELTDQKMKGRTTLVYAQVTEQGTKTEREFTIDDVLTEMHKIVIESA